MHPYPKNYSETDVESMSTINVLPDTQYRAARHNLLSLRVSIAPNVYHIFAAESMPYGQDKVRVKVFQDDKFLGVVFFIAGNNETLSSICRRAKVKVLNNGR